MRLTSRARSLLALFAWLATDGAGAALPREIAHAFLEAQIPLSAVSAYVQEIGEARPLVSHQPAKPMNPASTMKLVTTFAGLELLGPDYRWKTEAYAAGAIVDGVLEGDLVLKGYGDPKITIEQFHLKNARQRIGKVGDLWKPLLAGEKKGRVDLSKAFHHGGTEITEKK